MVRSSNGGFGKGRESRLRSKIGGDLHTGRKLLSRPLKKQAMVGGG